jgi:hypothetical protein
MGGIGSLSQCDENSKASCNAIALKDSQQDWEKGYKWYGFFVLNATCKNGEFVGYKKHINWMMYFALTLLALLFFVMVSRMAT